jgi:hypothetical protein
MKKLPVTKIAYIYSYELNSIHQRPVLGNQNIPAGEGFRSVLTGNHGH